LQDFDLSLVVLPDRLGPLERPTLVEPVYRQVPALAGVVQDLVEEAEMVAQRLDPEPSLASPEPGVDVVDPEGHEELIPEGRDELMGHDADVGAPRGGLHIAEALEPALRERFE